MHDFFFHSLYSDDAGHQQTDGDGSDRHHHGVGQEIKEIKELHADDLHSTKRSVTQVLFTIGLVLFVFIMIINIVLNKILKKGADDNE